MSIRLPELLKRVEPEVEAAVANARLRFNQQIRRHLRDETRLNLSANGEKLEEREVRSVRVVISSAFPLGLLDQSFDDDLSLSLALAPLSSRLEGAQRAIVDLMRPIQHLYASEEFTAKFADAGDVLESATELLSELLEEAGRAKALEKIFALSEDVLGVYRYEPSVQRSWDDESDESQSRIELYWCVIGITARLLDVSVEDLSVKVLAHELAHAYTHVGADADGRRWAYDAFAKTEVALKEGLAQYYTWRVLERLGKHFPGAMNAAEKLLPFQAGVYSVHKMWLANFTPEEVRDAMLTIRCRGAGTLAHFEHLLGKARERRRNRHAD